MNMAAYGRRKMFNILLLTTSCPQTGTKIPEQKCVNYNLMRTNENKKGSVNEQKLVSSK